MCVLQDKDEMETVKNSWGDGNWPISLILVLLIICVAQVQMFACGETGQKFVEKQNHRLKKIIYMDTTIYIKFHVKHFNTTDENTISLDDITSLVKLIRKLLHYCVFNLWRVTGIISRRTLHVYTALLVWQA